MKNYFVLLTVVFFVSKNVQLQAALSTVVFADADGFAKASLVCHRICFEICRFFKKTIVFSLMDSLNSLSNQTISKIEIRTLLFQIFEFSFVLKKIVDR